jgi:hypothetical protein
VLTLSISRPTKVEFVFTHPDARTQYCRGLTNFFAKLAHGGLFVRLPRSERAARSDPNGALILARPDMLEKDPVLRVQQHDARGRTIDNLLGHPGTITRATLRAAAHNSRDQGLRTRGGPSPSESCGGTSAGRPENGTTGC